MINYYSKYFKTMTFILLIAVTVISQFDIKSVVYGATDTSKHYCLNTGVVFVWKNSAGQWQNGLDPGSALTYSSKHFIGESKSDISIYPYNPNSEFGQIGYFNFMDSEFYHWNKGAAFDKESYDQKYYTYSASILSLLGNDSYNDITGDLSIANNVLLKTATGQIYDVKEQLSNETNGKATLIKLLGSPTTELKEAMNLMDPASEKYNPNVEGYLYFVPIIIQYTATTEVPDESETPTDGGIIIPEEEPVLPIMMEGEAILDLPKKTYEGHVVEAMDASQFVVGGKNYSARRLYEEDLASNLFKPAKSAAAIQRRTELTTTDITFNNIGVFPVTLEVKAESGSEFSASSKLSDTESIEVMKTPAIIENLGGVQKKNRKQILNIKVAANPNYPLTELWVEMERNDGTEKVRLEHTYAGLSFDETQNIIVNSESIKTRAIDQTEADQYYTTVQLLFLTKNDMQEEFTYRIYVKDSRGQEDRVEKDFIVAPDLPPQAKIETETSFIRAKGTDVATVVVEDASLCDGDQLNRTWFARSMSGNGAPLGDQDTWLPMNLLSGYRDISFGSGKQVAFDKTGVGAVHFKLKVQDIWVEETLPEYVTEEDYLKSEAEAATEVINIAPTVSLNPIFSREKNVLLLAAEKTTFDDLNSGSNILIEKLIKSGVDANITIEKVPGTTTSEAIRGYYPGTSLSLPFGFNGKDTFLEDRWFSIDEENLYTVNGTWISGTHDDYPEMPYTISSNNAEDGTSNWTYTITQDVMDIAPGFADSFAHDDSGKYLFFRYGGKTLVIAKDTGAYLTTIDMTLGDYNFVGGSGVNKDTNIYTIKADGIYAISTETGGIRKIFSGQISGKARKVGGQINFLVHSGPMNINRGKLEISSEHISFSRIRNTENDAPGTVYNCLGIDSRGAMIIGINGERSIRIYGSDNGLINEVSGWNADRTFSATPAYDESGKCNYITASWEVKGSTKYYSYAGVWGVYDNLYSNCSMYSTNGFRTNAGYPMFAMQSGDKVYIQTGATWAGLYGGGSVMSYYNEYAYLCTFDLTTGTGSFNAVGDFAFGVAGEYGRYTDPMVAASYTYNGDSVDVDPETSMNGLTAKIMLRYKSLDEMISRFLNKHAEGNAAGENVAGNANFFFVNQSDMNAGFYDRLCESIADENNVYDAALAVKKSADAEEGSVTRQYILDPGKTYYYEYDVKDAGDQGQPLSWEFLTENQLAESMLEDGAYYVTHTELEDFNDDETNPYFCLPTGVISRGICKGADLNKGDTKLPNRIFNAESTITFDVPPGKKALLSFDYDIRSKGWSSSEIYVNEQRWNRLVGISGNTGHYTTPEFLMEGLNSIKMKASDYGTLPLTAYVYIDNLKVIYVDNDSEAQFDRNKGVSDYKIEETGDGWTHYSGNFDTPSLVMDYRAYPGEYIQSDFATTTSGMIVKNIDRPDNKTLLIDVPEGKTALDVGMYIKSSPASTSSNNYNVIWKWVEKAHTWTCYAKAEYGTAPLQIPYDWRVSLGPMTGLNNFTESARSTYRAWGDFTKVGFYLANDKPLPVIEGKYFYENDPAGNPAKMYVENENFTKKTVLSFSDSSDELWYIRDLKLYSIQDGIKVYAEEKAITSEDMVSQWVTKNCAAMTVKLKGVPDEPKESLIYKKGQLVAYDIFYSDYEADPSRRSYWRYLHTPMNDGPHPMAAAVLDQEGAIVEMKDIILDRPIDRFYIDGKYTVEHWQEDNTSREDSPLDGNGYPLGFPDYDKLSNVETITFYVMGTASAPWIKEIKTQTLKGTDWSDSAVDYRDTFRLKIKIDDYEKDTLSLATEVYLDRRLIYTHLKKGIEAGASGEYPAVLTGELPDPTQTGSYQVVCTVRDETGAGIGTHRFMVENIVPRLRIHRIF